MIKIPTEFINKSQLYNVKEGTTGYIVPWGMWIDMEGNAYLNEQYDLHPNPGGTVSLRITKVRDGYIAHLDEFNYGREPYTWTPQEGPAYMSPERVCYGKVVAFGTKEYKIGSLDANKLRALINECILNEDYEKAQYYQNILDQLN